MCAIAEEPAWHIYPANLHAAQPLSVQTVRPSLSLPLHSPHTQTPPMQPSDRSFPIPKENIFVHAGLGPHPGCSRSGNPLPASNQNPLSPLTTWDSTGFRVGDLRHDNQLIYLALLIFSEHRLWECSYCNFKPLTMRQSMYVAISL